MPLEDRQAIVATVEETYALMGRALAIDVPGVIIENAVRPEVMQQLREAAIDPYVTDEEILGLFHEAYYGLVEAVLQIHSELLGEQGERYDVDLASRGLAGSGLWVKVQGFRRTLGRGLARVLPFPRWVKKTFEWGNIILGSLGGVPVVGVIADPIRELKEAIEAQGDDDQTQ